MVALVVLAAVVVIGLLIAASAIRILREYERGVVFRLGRLIALKGPGLLLPDPVHRPDGPGGPADRDAQRPAAGGDHPRQRHRQGQRGRLLPRHRPGQGDHRGRELPRRHLARSRRPRCASVLGKAELDAAARRARDAQRRTSRQIIDEQTEPWGIKVTTVEIKDVEIPEDMQRAIARQAEAERERRAKIINAEGEFQAAEKLAEAADIISQQPGDPPAALPADAARDRRRQEHDDRLPAADRPDGRLQEHRRRAGQHGHPAPGDPAGRARCRTRGA